MSKPAKLKDKRDRDYDWDATVKILAALAPLGPEKRLHTLAVVAKMFIEDRISYEFEDRP